MPELKQTGVAYRVNIIESERGWGSRVDDTKFFTTQDEAKQFCADYNSKNTSTMVPDWYMYAEYVGPTAILG